MALRCAEMFENFLLRTQLYTWPSAQLIERTAWDSQSSIIIYLDWMEVSIFNYRGTVYDVDFQHA